MFLVKILLWAVGLFVAYHFVIGFANGLGIKRRPRLRVVSFDDDQKEEST